MKARFLVIVILGIVLGLAVYGYFKAVPAPSGRAEALPQIEITPRSFDFGKVEYGKKLEHIFRVKNSGSGVLAITRLSTSCGCTTAEISREEISPGAEADLRVVYDTGAMGGSHAKGKQERTIYVKTNDPVNPQVEVEIFADVK